MGDILSTCAEGRELLKLTILCLDRIVFSSINFHQNCGNEGA